MLGKQIPCPHCTEKAVEEALTSEDFHEKLGFSVDPFISPAPSLTGEGLVPESEETYLEEGVLREVGGYLSETCTLLSKGALPQRSLLFGLGIRGRLVNCTYPLLASAYIGGLEPHPLVSAHDLEFWKLRERIDELEAFYSSKVGVISLEEGTSRAGLQVCKGVMQVRASRNLPTIFVTTWSAKSVSTLVDVDPTGRYFLAEPHILHYKTENKDKYSKYVLGVLGLDNSIGVGDNYESED